MQATYPSGFQGTERRAAFEYADAVQLALFFALVKFVIHLVTNLWQAHIGWGYFRDELYYIACGHHLAFGYVDHAPMVALQARLAMLLFGKSLAGIRMLSALAGAARVFLTGILCYRLGGRISAQALAMLAVLMAPQYLGADGYLSMNSFESIFWMGCLLALLRIVRAGPNEPSELRAAWLGFGVCAGLGLENKPTMAFFLIALCVALLLNPSRRMLGTRYAALGVAVMLALAAPYLLWNGLHHWPMLEFLREGIKQHKNIPLPPGQFLLAQLKMLNPIAVVLWISGLIWLLCAAAARHVRWLGQTYLLFLALMMTLHGKDYYLSPIYPLLFAAGGIALTGGVKQIRGMSTLRGSLVGVYAAVLLLTGIFILPAAIPVFRVQHQLAYLQRHHLVGKPDEKWAQGPLPQFFSDRFGWQEIANGVTAAYNQLPREDQARCGIFGANYGDASAINFLAPAPDSGRRLPTAVSGQNSYFLWGPHGYSGQVMIVATSATIEEMRQYYGDVTIAARADNPWAMPYERINIYIARHRKTNFMKAWPEMKDYI
jgi:hypothetical protein